MDEDHDDDDDDDEDSEEFYENQDIGMYLSERVIHIYIHIYIYNLFK